MSLEKATAPPEAECSLYFAEHNPVSIECLLIERERHGNGFLVSITGAVELRGFEELDGPEIPFSVQGRVDFAGIVLIPGNLSPEPGTPTEASDVVSDFVSVESLKQPRWDRFRYVFEPA